jgi:hypothetical protein
MKKYKDRSFAAGVDREEVEHSVAATSDRDPAQSNAPGPHPPRGGPATSFARRHEQAEQAADPGKRDT